MDLREDVRGLRAARLRGFKIKEGSCIATKGVQAVPRAEVGTDVSWLQLTCAAEAGRQERSTTRSTRCSSPTTSAPAAGSRCRRRYARWRSSRRVRGGQRRQLRPIRPGELCGRCP
jgi:hypothetical protein